MTILLTQPESEDDWQQARMLIEEYVESLTLDLSFQNVMYELGHLREEYGPPTGAFLLAEENGVCLGCVGLRRFTEDAGEVKRLYIRPGARGRGIGRLLAERIVAVGKVLGYARLRLDTLPFMNEAHRLYMSLGFQPIHAYRFNPVQGTAFLELELNPAEANNSPERP